MAKSPNRENNMSAKNTCSTVAKMILVVIFYLSYVRGLHFILNCHLFEFFKINEKFVAKELLSGEMSLINFFQKGSEFLWRMISFLSKWV